jgi:site-specific recombinase XerD
MPWPLCAAGLRHARQQTSENISQNPRCSAGLQANGRNREGGVRILRKTLEDAIDAFHAQHAENVPETHRKYKRVLGYLNAYCTQASIRLVDQITVETMDGYALWRNKINWTWIKEIEILRQFFSFCIEREWTRKNPAKALKRPRLLEANDVVPFTSAEIIRIIAACDQIGPN